MAKTAQPTALDARAELRAWYLGRLRPRLEDAVTAGTVERSAVEELEYQLSDFFDTAADLNEEAA